MAEPYWDEAISFPADVGTTAPYDFWVSVAERNMGQSSTTRGRQYELDTVQAGEYHPTFDNRDANLSPTNTASPYSPRVLPYRPVRRRAQYPATVNKLTVDQATCGSTLTASGQHIDDVVPPWTSYSWWWTLQAESDAYTGPNVFQQVVSTAHTAPYISADMNGWTVKPGEWHAIQVFMRATAGGTTPQAQLWIVWRDSTGANLATVKGTAVTLAANSRTWQQVTVTGHAPANACGGTLHIVMANSVACTWQAGAFQVEYDTAPTTWVKPGDWYSIFTGYVERWPETYTDQGFFTHQPLVAVDAFGYLSQHHLQPSFYADVLALGPRFFYPLDEGQGAAYAVDRANQQNPAPVTDGIYGGAKLSFGNTISTTTKPTPTNVAGGGFLGAGSQVVSMTQDTSSTVAGHDQATYLDLLAAGMHGPQAGSDGGYTRIIAFRATQTPPAPAGSTECPLWLWSNSSFAPPYKGYDGFMIHATNHVDPGAAVFAYGDGTYSVFTSVNVCDGDWHLLAAVVDTNEPWVHLAFDGTPLGYARNADPELVWPENATGGDAVGALVVAGANTVEATFAGDVACCAEFPSKLSDTQLGDLYTSWRKAWAGDTSAQRYMRVLDWAGYNGQRAITSSPSTTNYGPASDIRQGASGTYGPVKGTDAQTALQDVVDTENGQHFVAADGTITFLARNARYGMRDPKLVLGEDAAAGEVPYEQVGFDFDPTHLANDAQITQFYSQAVFESFASDSRSAYGTRSLSRTVNTMDPYEAQAAAEFFTYVYGSPLLRVSTLAIRPSATPGIWAQALGLEQGDRVRVMRRAPGHTVQWDGFVEQLAWSFDPAKPDAVLTMQLSPAAKLAFWQLAADHTTLAAAANAGDTTITLNPLPDAATVPYTAHVPGKLAHWNQLSNPGFETGTAPWTVYGGTLAQSTDYVHSGTYSGVVTPDGVSAQDYISSETIPVSPGDKVKASAFVYFTVAAGNYGVGVDWFDSTKTYLSTSSNPGAGAAGAWLDTTNTYTAPANAAYAEIVPTHRDTPPASHPMYVDDASLINLSYTGPTIAVGPGGLVLRIGAGTSTWEEIPVATVTTNGGTQVTYPNGNPEPGAYTGYTSVTITLAQPLAHSYPAGTTVSEALTGSDDPTHWDASSELGSTTIVSY